MKVIGEAGRVKQLNPIKILSGNKFKLLGFMNKRQNEMFQKLTHVFFGVCNIHFLPAYLRKWPSSFDQWISQALTLPGTTLGSGLQRWIRRSLSLSLPIGQGYYSMILPISDKSINKILCSRQARAYKMSMTQAFFPRCLISKEGDRFFDYLIIIQYILYYN